MVQIWTNSKGYREYMRRSNRVYWLDHEHWACGRHLPACVLPASIERCWLCSNKRAPLIDRPEASAEGTSTVQNRGVKKIGRRPPRPKMVVARKAAPISAEATPSVKPTSKPSSTTPKSPTKTTTRGAATKKAAPRKTSLLTDCAGGVCAWHECNKQARPRSKYCSRNCSNKNARARHKARK